MMNGSIPNRIFASEMIKVHPELPPILKVRTIS